jgi:hypothetical protein
MRAAADRIRTSGPSNDRYLLVVDEHDPHEPFDTRQPYAGMYRDPGEGAALAIWPPHLVDAVRIPPVRHGLRSG